MKQLQGFDKPEVAARFDILYSLRLRAARINIPEVAARVNIFEAAAMVHIPDVAARFDIPEVAGPCT